MLSDRTEKLPDNIFLFYIKRDLISQTYPHIIQAIRSKSLKILYLFTAIPVLSDIQPLQIPYVLLHSDVPDLRHSNVHRMLPEGNGYDVQLRFFHKQVADFWKRSQTLWKTPGHILPAILFLPDRWET